jgi:hypothetical protein
MSKQTDAELTKSEEAIEHKFFEEKAKEQPPPEPESEPTAEAYPTANITSSGVLAECDDETFWKIKLTN